MSKLDEHLAFIEHQVNTGSLSVEDGVLQMEAAIDKQVRYFNAELSLKCLSVPSSEIQVF